MASAGPCWQGRGVRSVLGTMEFGRRAEEGACRAMLGAFLARGHCEVDTALMYADGASERILGALLAAEPAAAERGEPPPSACRAPARPPGKRQAALEAMCRVRSFLRASVRGVPGLLAEPPKREGLAGVCWLPWQVSLSVDRGPAAPLPRGLPRLIPPQFSRTGWERRGACLCAPPPPVLLFALLDFPASMAEDSGCSTAPRARAGRADMSAPRPPAHSWTAAPWLASGGGKGTLHVRRGTFVVLKRSLSGRSGAHPIVPSVWVSWGRLAAHPWRQSTGGIFAFLKEALFKCRLLHLGPPT